MRKLIEGLEEAKVAKSVGKRSSATRSILARASKSLEKETNDWATDLASDIARETGVKVRKKMTWRGDLSGRIAFDVLQAHDKGDVLKVLTKNGIRKGEVVVASGLGRDGDVSQYLISFDLDVLGE